MDLDAWINEPPEESESDSESDTPDNMFIKLDKSEYSKAEKYQHELTEEEKEQIREHRKLEQMNNPHYLKGTTKKYEKNEDDSEMIPIAELDLSVPLKVIHHKRSDKYLSNITKEKKKSKKKAKKYKKHKQDR